MITNDISSDSSAFLSAEKLIACLIFFLIILDHCILSFDSNSSLIWIFKDDEYIAFRNVSHFSLNSIFNSFCKFCIENSFSIKRDLVNLYVWNTFFSSTLFKKLIQNWFLISFITSWYEFRICTIFAHTSSFLHLFQIHFFWRQHLSSFDELIISSEFWSTTRFTCMRCWLQIFCKLCLLKELNNLINIDRAVTALYSCVEQWNNELIEMWKALSSRKRIWKRCRTDDAWTEIMRMWNSYHDAIKLIKNQFWINFLNKIKEKKVFQTYKFIKSWLIEKLFSIQNAQKKLKTEFNEKCETFLKAMYSSFSKVQINEKLLLNESIQWSRIIEKKIKHAINFSAFRKALESDDMSFAIMQWACKSVLKIFNLMYLNLIESDYHSKIWRENTEIILKKPNKSNYLILKTYRIITLLNCLNKIAKKLIAMQLLYTAKTNDKLLEFNQMRDRKQRSAIDAVLNLVHDAQMAKSRENTLTCLLLDIKDVFDHVMLKQLIKILIKQKILINLINWIKCFLQNRIIDLAFDEERQKSKEIFTEILQESSILLILFLIYIRHLFSKIRARIKNLQSLSYIDDVALYVEGKSIDKNVKKLEKTTKIAFTWANKNAVQFNDSKFELIHFENHKATLDQTIMLFNDTVVKSKICIQWLEVWLNRKLNFKMHVQIKIIAITRTLHSLFKLMNSEWRLNAKSERQLYLACVTIISDYDVEIWWNNQKSHAIKFRKLQNAALRKILRAFRTSLIEVMQIEAEISSVKVQLDQKCKNYAIKIVELPKKHSTRKQTLISYSSQYFIELNLNLNASKYLNWNEMKANLSWKVKKCKDRLTQIYQILNKVQKTLNSIKEIEISHFKKSWDQKIEYLTKM